jgi:hypothetical protein
MPCLAHKDSAAWRALAALPGFSTVMLMFNPHPDITLTRKNKRYSN